MTGAPAASPAPGPPASSVPPSASGPAAKPSFPPPVAATIDWLKQRFGAWYADNPPPMPDRFTRREFGFIQWPERPGPPPFVRHRAYTDAAKFQRSLAWRAPHSVYYSTAYYRKPGELKMAEKQWLGAELIFDLDADHLAEAEAAKARGEEMPIEEQLRIVKGQFQRLLDDFLFGDLGIDERDCFITFSGGRGYHAHITDPRYLDLDARARREIVDFVTGKVPAERGSDGPDLSAFVWQEAVGVQGGGRFAKALTRERTHPVDAPAWQGRMTRSLVAMLREKVLEADHADALAWLKSLKGVDKSAESFVAGFNEEKLERIAQGYLEQGRVIKRVCRHVLEQHAIPMAKGETDEPVTADVKRLIRLPGSLHGKSGLKVVTLTRDTLDDFDPFQDAVAFPVDEAVRFTPRGDGTVTLCGDTVSVRAGEPTEVPVAHAVWWSARQQGTVQP